MTPPRICRPRCESRDGLLGVPRLRKRNQPRHNAGQYPYEYILPDWFLANNVKITTDLDELPLHCIIFSDNTAATNKNGAIEATINKSTDPGSDEFLGGGQAGSRSNKSCGNDHLAEYRIPYSKLLELRDVVAAAFVRDQQDRLWPSHPSVLLCSSADDSVAFIDGIISHVAKDLHATLVSMDLEDLEDLGWEFDHQDMQESRPRLEPSNGITSLQQMSNHYFAIRSERHADDNDWDRNRKAIESILDVQSDKFQQRQTSEKDPLPPATNLEPPVADSPPLLIHIRRSIEITSRWRGHRLLARFRDRIQERRKCGQKVVLLVSLIGAESVTSSNKQRVSTKVSAAQESTVTITLTPSNHRGQTSSENRSRASEVNIRRLKHLLRWRIPQFLAPEVLNLLKPYSSWTVLELGEEYETILSSEWERDKFQQVLHQIVGRTFGKSHAGLEDIRIVLSRFRPELDVDRDSVSESEDAESESWTQKLDRIMEDTADEFEEDLVSCIVNPDDLRYTFDDVIMDEETKDTIRHLVSLSHFKPQAASAFLLEQIRITGALFYGPPGTGKTHLGKVIAKASGASMLIIDGATIQSKWIGETEKYIKAAFTLSKKLYPCVLFIDEVDAMFYRRDSGDTSWQRSALAEFLTGMDGLTKSPEAPFVVVATNRPADLDEAFYRRLPQEIYFKLPDAESRAKILRLFLKQEDLDPRVDIKDLAIHTEGYSGSDLHNMCAQAAVIWGIEQAKTTMPDQKLEGTTHRLQLTPGHLEKARMRIRPSVSKNTMEELSEFVRRFNPESVHTTSRTGRRTTDASSDGGTLCEFCLENGIPGLLGTTADGHKTDTTTPNATHDPQPSQGKAPSLNLRTVPNEAINLGTMSSIKARKCPFCEIVAHILVPELDAKGPLASLQIFAYRFGMRFDSSGHGLQASVVNQLNSLSRMEETRAIAKNIWIVAVPDSPPDPIPLGSIWCSIPKEEDSHHFFGSNGRPRDPSELETPNRLSEAMIKRTLQTLDEQNPAPRVASINVDSPGQIGSIINKARRISRRGKTMVAKAANVFCYRGQQTQHQNDVPDRQKRPCQVLLIDVKEQRIVPGTLEQSYLALSYVQGKPENMLEMSRHSKDRFGMVGALAIIKFHLPQLIHDAMTVTQRLGKRFLWVDALCIVQDDESHRADQFRHMDAIYRNAYLTIVAWTATSADTPLPGIGIDLRPQVIRRKTRGLLLENRLSDDIALLGQYHDICHYGTRAWTFQECLLSQRCLVFHHHREALIVSSNGSMIGSQSQGVGRCNRFNALQTVNDKLDNGDDGDDGMSRVLTSPKYPAQKLALYMQFVEQYTGMNLTYQSDRLNAFRGALSQMKPHTGPMSHGLPLTKAPLGLMWNPKPRSSSESTLTARNALFPSWSWAGWEGEISFSGCFADDMKIGFEHIEASAYIASPRSLVWSSPATELSSDNKSSLPDIDDSDCKILHFTAETVKATHMKVIRGEADAHYSIVSILCAEEEPDASEIQGRVDSRFLSPGDFVMKISKCEFIRIASRDDNAQRFSVKAMLIMWKGDVAERVCMCEFSEAAWEKADRSFKEIHLG